MLNEGDIVGIDADREYREQYAERVRRGAKLVPIEDHLEELRRAVRSFSPDAR